MPRQVLVRVMLAVAIAAAIAVTRAALDAQPTPYRPDHTWPKEPLPQGMRLQCAPGYDFDAEGNLWMFSRQGTPILKFDASGKFVKGFGDGMFVWPHGLTVDQDGNIWVTDGQAKDGKGQQVFKLSPEGKVLLTLGKAGVAGKTNDTFGGVSSVAIAPNGDIFVADGHEPCDYFGTPEQAASCTSRVLKFSKDGKFIKTWGKSGPEPGNFKDPHALAFDSQGRLFVADRRNHRIQIFDQDGKFLAEWRQFGRPSALKIDKKTDTLYAADTGTPDQGTKFDDPRYIPSGVRVGNAKTGEVIALIPRATEEGVAVDAQGNVYGCTPTGRMYRDVKRY